MPESSLLTYICLGGLNVHAIIYELFICVNIHTYIVDIDE